MFNPMDRIEIKRIILEKFKFGVNAHLDQDIMLRNVDARVLDDMIYPISRHMVLQLKAEIVGQKLSDFKYPADWREAFKERWFPKWLLKKYPVKYTVLEVKALYPQLSLPPDQHRPVFHVAEFPKGWMKHGMDS